MTPSPTVAPTYFSTSKYEITGAVDQFHNSLRVQGSNEFPTDDPTDTDYYVGVVATALVPLVVGVALLIPCYWTFLCCRNGCCHDTFYKRFKVCCCCSSDKGEGCMRTGHPNKRPLTARALLFFFFCLIVGLNVGINNVRFELNHSAEKMMDLLNDLGDMMTSLNDYALEMNATAGKISTFASNLGCTDDYASQTSSIGDASDTIAEYAVLISEQIGDLPDQMFDMADDIDDRGQSYVDRAGLGLAGLGMLYAAFGIIGICCFEGKGHPFRCATGFLAFTNAFGVLMLIVLGILLAVELTAGIVMGDFCAADDGPSNALVSVMQSQTDDDSEAIEIMQFYATCQGSNPMSAYLDTQQEAVTNMTDILDTYKDLFIHSTMCCDSSYDTNDIDPDTVGDSCTFYSSSNTAACTANTVCDYDGGSNNGGCVEAGGCSNASFTGIVNSIEYLALDDDGPLVGFFSEFECAKVNPQLAKLVNEIMCDSFIESLWWMAAVHICVFVLMFLVMLMSSFARQVVLEAASEEATEKGGGDMKGVMPTMPPGPGKN